MTSEPLKRYRQAATFSCDYQSSEEKKIDSKNPFGAEEKERKYVFLETSKVIK